MIISKSNRMLRKEYPQLKKQIPLTNQIYNGNLFSFIRKYI